MRKCLVALLALTVLFAFTACSGSKPEKTVSSFLTSLKKGKYEDADKYTEAKLFEDMSEQEKPLLNVYFGSLSYSQPKVVTQNPDNATVSVELTAVDISAVMQNFLLELSQKAADNASGMDNLTDEQLDKMLLEKFKAKDAPKKSLAITVNVVKKDNKWLLVRDNTLRAGLFLQTPENINESYSDDPHGDGNYAVVDTIEAKATYKEADAVADLCGFIVDGQNLFMSCDAEQIKLLDGKYKNKEVSIKYSILKKDNAAPEDEANDELYVLESVIEQ